MTVEMTTRNLDAHDLMTLVEAACDFEGRRTGTPARLDVVYDASDGRFMFRFRWAGPTLTGVGDEMITALAAVVGLIGARRGPEIKTFYDGDRGYAV